jgi:hypothetical protein
MWTTKFKLAIEVDQDAELVAADLSEPTTEPRELAASNLEIGNSEEREHVVWSWEKHAFSDLRLGSVGCYKWVKMVDKIGVREATSVRIKKWRIKQIG